MSESEVSEYTDFDSQVDDADALGDADVCEERLAVSGSWGRRRCRRRDEAKEGWVRGRRPERVHRGDKMPSRHHHRESKAAFGSDKPKVKDDMDAKQLPNLLFVSMFSEALTYEVDEKFHVHPRLDRRTENTTLTDVFMKARDVVISACKRIKKSRSLFY